MKTNTARKNKNEDGPQAKLRVGHGEELSRKAQAAIVAPLANPTIPRAGSDNQSSLPMPVTTPSLPLIETPASSKTKHAACIQ
jgi:hypothetical protein